MARTPQFDVVVLGGGPAGTGCALRASAGGLSVLLLEPRSEGIGGAWVHEGPLVADALAGSSRVGAASDWVDMVRRLAGTVLHVARSTAEELERTGVTVAPGRGFLSGPGSVMVLDPDTGDEQGMVEAKHFVLATGTERLRVHGFTRDGNRLLWPEDLLRLGAMPKSALIAGDGPLACTLAQYLCERDAGVVLAASGPRLLPGAGAALDSSVGKRLASLGCGIAPGAAIQRVVPGWDAESGNAVTLSDGSTHTVDAVIGCPRRAASVAMQGGRKLGIERGGDGRIITDRRFGTGAPGVYAIGGVREPDLSPELCRADGEALADMLLGSESAGPSAGAHAIHRLPGAAWAGIEREDAEAAGLSVRAGFADLKATLCSRMGRASEGFVQILAETETGEILGVQAVAPDAAELVAPVVHAMRLEFTVHDLAGLAAPWPSLGEAVMLAARAACGE